MHRECAQGLECLLRLRKGRDVRQQRRERGARLGHLGELGAQTLLSARERERFTLHSGEVGLDPLTFVAPGLRREPTRRHRVERRSGLLLAALGLGGRPAPCRDGRARLALLRLERVAVGHSGAQARDFAREFLASRRAEFLRHAEFLIAQHSREELRTLTRRERLHHRQFLLAREVGVEELRARHAKATLQHLGDRRHRVGDRDLVAVEVELGHGEPTHHAVPVPREVEVELHPHRRSRRRPVEPQRLVAAARRVAAVERPRDRLEDRRLAGTVGPDDAGEPGVELDVRLGMLTEVRESQPREFHASVPGNSRVGSERSASSR